MKNTETFSSTLHPATEHHHLLKRLHSQTCSSRSLLLEHDASADLRQFMRHAEKSVHADFDLVGTVYTMTN